MKSKNTGDWKAYAAVIVSQVLWGFSFFASRKGLDVTHVFILLSHRFLIAFLLMSLPALRLISLRGKGKRLPLLILLGLAQPVVYFFGEQYGLLHSNTIFSGLMIAMIPIVCTLLAIPVLGERVNGRQVFFSLLSVGGVVGVGLMQKSAGALDWIGVLGLLVAVFSATAYNLISRGISRDFTAFERTYMMMLEGAVVFTMLALVHCRGSLAAYWQPFRDREYLLAVLFLSVCCSVAAFFLYGYSVGRLSVARQTVFANLTTVVSIFAGVVFLREPFSWLSLLCCLLILVGIYGVQRVSAQAEPSRAED